MEPSETPIDAVTVVHSGRFEYTPGANFVTGVPHWVMLLCERESPLQTFLDSVPAPRRVRVIISLEVYPDDQPKRPPIE